MEDLSQSKGLLQSFFLFFFFDIGAHRVALAAVLELTLDQVGLTSTEICLPLSLKCLD